MAIRQTTHVLKNTLFQNQTLPSSGVLQGEPLVNLGDGILYFTGGTAGSPTWVQSDNATPGYFEVGSNLYQLKIRDKIFSYSGVTNLSGLFLSGTSTGFVLANISDINTFSAFTYNDNNTLKIYESNGEVNSVTINFFSGLTINGDFTVTGNTNLQALTATTTNINGNLTVTGDTSLQALSATSIFVSGFVPTQVVYVGPNGELTGENAFTYNQTGNTLNVDNIEVSNNVVIQGDLTVLGAAISAFTTSLYVEDPNIPINYNPTGSTTLTSVNAGFTIQDGSGVSGSSVNLDIVQMLSLTGLTSNQTPLLTEYTGLTGYSNRGLITQLNDIVIRSTDVTDGGSPGDVNGVRVLAEWDILDGGVY